MQFRVKLNPLLAYLLKRKYINYIEELTPIFWLWIVNIVIIFALYLNSLVLLALEYICLFGAILLPILFVPVVITYTCASATSRLQSNQSYELLTLTNISDAALVWSYVVVTLYRFRLLLIIVLGFAPLTILIPTVTWRWEGDCMTTPLGAASCDNSLAESPFTVGQKVAAATLASIAMLELSIGTVGIYLLPAVVGSLLGFMQMDRLLKLVSAGILGFIMSIVTGIIILPELTAGIVFRSGNNLLPLLLLLVFALIPYLLVFGLMRVAAPLVRRPA